MNCDPDSEPRLWAVLHTQQQGNNHAGIQSLRTARCQPTLGKEDSVVSYLQVSAQLSWFSPESLQSAPEPCTWPVLSGSAPRASQAPAYHGTSGCVSSAGNKILSLVSSFILLLAIPYQLQHLCQPPLTLSTKLYLNTSFAFML